MARTQTRRVSVATATPCRMSTIGMTAPRLAIGVESSSQTLTRFLETATAEAMNRRTKRFEEMSTLHTLPDGTKSVPNET